MQVVKTLLLSCIAFIGLAAMHWPAIAASFLPFWLATSDPEAGVSVIGPIEVGDASRFMGTLNAIAHTRAGARVVIVDLDTPGGLVDEGWRIATIVLAKGYNTGIYPGQTCASACSLIFFAGGAKIVGAGTRIGVHRASITASETETPGTLDTSLWIAERLRSLGAPQSVVAKLLITPPGGVAWLTTSDLASVQGIIFGPSPRGTPSDDYESGWRFSRAQADATVCPSDLSQFASGCRAGAASIVTHRR